MKKIPKKIYYVWIGNKEKPEIFYQCYNSWKEIMPNYEIIEINENNFPLEEHLKKNRFLKECYERELWAYVADYIRIQYLYENGGIFLDTDMEIIKDFTKIPELQNIEEFDFFASFESDDGIGLGLFGSKAKSIIIEKMIEFYKNEIWEKPLFTIPQIIRYILKEKMNYNFSEKDIFDKDRGIYILRKEYFYPFLPNEKFDKSMLKEENYAIHWWQHSWKGNKPFLFLKTKHLRGIKKYLKKLGIYIQIFRDFIRNKK